MKTNFPATLALSRLSSAPKFKQNQQVSFLGGTGKIKTFLPDSGKWSYEIEMDLGPEPDIGRVGPEATILLYEADIHGPCNATDGYSG